MRKISKLIIHCSATREGQDISVDTIRRWHVEERGWSDIGYHFVITLDGTIEEGRPIEISGAHAKGENHCSIGICYIGGVDKNLDPKDTRTEEQKKSLEDLLINLKNSYSTAKIYGHKDFSNKACPSFNAKSEYEWISNFI